MSKVVTDLRLCHNFKIGRSVQDVMILFLILNNCTEMFYFTNNLDPNVVFEEFFELGV